MTEPLPDGLAAFIEPMLAMCGKQFPRECHSCRRVYKGFAQFAKETKPKGAPTIVLDEPVDPIGMMSWTNCPCGSTLIVHCVDEKGDMHRMFMAALDAASRQSGRTTEELLLAIRAVVRKRVLSGS